MIDPHHPSGADRPAARRGQGGFSMIELLIVVLLAAVILVPLFGILDMTYNRLTPVRESNDTAQQLRVFRSTLANDWARARVIRLNRCRGWQAAPGPGCLPADVEPNRTLTPARMDCHAGRYPWYGLSGPPSVPGSSITPLFALNTHVSGNNNGARIVYSAFRYPDPQEPGQFLMDIVRRQCNHIPQTVPFMPAGGLDYWADACGQIVTACNIPNPNLGGTYTADRFERVVLRWVREFRSASSCNNLNIHPHYGPCDVNLSLIGADGQFTTVKLFQQVVSTGVNLNGGNANINLDIVGRTS